MFYILDLYLILERPVSQQIAQQSVVHTWCHSAHNRDERGDEDKLK